MTRVLRCEVAVYTVTAPANGPDEFVSRTQGHEHETAISDLYNFLHSSVLPYDKPQLSAHPFIEGACPQVTRKELVCRVIYGGQSQLGLVQDLAYSR